MSCRNVMFVTSNFLTGGRDSAAPVSGAIAFWFCPTSCRPPTRGSARGRVIGVFEPADVLGMRSRSRTRPSSHCPTRLAAARSRSCSTGHPTATHRSDGLRAVARVVPASASAAIAQNAPPPTVANSQPATGVTRPNKEGEAERGVNRLGAGEQRRRRMVAQRVHGREIGGAKTRSVERLRRHQKPIDRCQAR